MCYLRGLDCDQYFLWRKVLCVICQRCRFRYPGMPFPTWGFPSGCPVPWQSSVYCCYSPKVSKDQWFHPHVAKWHDRKASTWTSLGSTSGSGGPQLPRLCLLPQWNQKELRIFWWHRSDFLLGLVWSWYNLLVFGMRIGSRAITVSKATGLPASLLTFRAVMKNIRKAVANSTASGNVQTLAALPHAHCAPPKMKKGWELTGC